IVAIPTTGNIDSLNVSVAAGIFLYEIRRQQA
ncbi:MAG TPA: 23S rRNA (guanosine(2251)-2'-O)-methyltransferase RlmB, partial [Sphaerochaeta sp.]|nr:23S rRNA (guanosine(2251)-2'-O)-methyltransferase RlmB [Sphaerochaeta sp.]